MDEAAQVMTEGRGCCLVSDEDAVLGQLDNERLRGAFCMSGLI